MAKKVLPASGWSHPGPEMAVVLGVGSAILLYCFVAAVLSVVVRWVCEW